MRRVELYVFKQLALPNGVYELQNGRHAVHRLKLTATSFVDCWMERAAFDENVWKHVTFQASTLTNSDWYVVKHDRLLIERCELTDARFEETTLNGVDISTSQFLSLHIAKDDVEGCIIHNEQAPILLAICGIRLKGTVD